LFSEHGVSDETRFECDKSSGVLDHMQSVVRLRQSILVQPRLPIMVRG